VCKRADETQLRDCLQGEDMREHVHVCVRMHSVVVVDVRRGGLFVAVCAALVVGNWGSKLRRDKRVMSCTAPHGADAGSKHICLWVWV
jgi:hypothetical protein